MTRVNVRNAMDELVGRAPHAHLDAYNLLDPAGASGRSPVDLPDCLMAIIDEASFKMGCHKQARAYFDVQADTIMVPCSTWFRGPSAASAYANVVMHEMIHATGARHRLNRSSIVHHSYGDYGGEEMTAEFGAVLLALHLGLTPRWDSSAAYLRHWSTFVTGAKMYRNPLRKMLEKVAKDASAAAKWLVGK